MTKECPRCGKQNPSDARACNQCGQWINQVLPLPAPMDDRKYERIRNFVLLIVIFIGVGIAGRHLEGQGDTSTPSQAVAQSATTPRATRTPGPTWTPRPTRTPTPAPSETPVPQPVLHTVVAGDTLGKIATQYATTVDSIVTANNIDSPNSLSVGTQLVIPMQTEGEVVNESEQAVVAPTATPVRAPSFLVFRNYYETHTEVQWVEYFNQYRGMKVKWTGTVMEVRERSGNYSVIVEMDSGEWFRESDVSWRVSREEALKIPKDGTITFEGSVSDWDDLIWFSIELTDVTHTYQ